MFDYGILLISCVVEIYLLHTFFECFFEKRMAVYNKKFIRYLSYVLVTGSIYVTNLIGNGDLNLLIIPMIYWIYICFVFDGRIGSRLMCFLMAYSILWGCECLYAILFARSNLEYKAMSEIPLEVISLKLLTCIIFIVIEQFEGKKERKMDHAIFFKYLLVPISGFGMMLGVFYSGVNVSDDNRLKWIMIVSFTLMLFGNIMVFYAFNQYAENMHNTMVQQILLAKREADLNYYKQVAEVHDVYNEMAHNTRHYLGILSLLAREKNYDAIINIIQELGSQMDENEGIIYSDESHILNAILSEKRTQAQKKGITFDAYVEPGIRLDKIEDADLIAMLGNLLDNAIRAATEDEQKHDIKVRIFMQEIGGFCIVKIVNGFSGNIIVKKGFFVSTKKDGEDHGIGMKSVNRMAEKYGGFLECKVDKKRFETMLLLAVTEE